MSASRLRITELSLQDGRIVISSMSVIDTDTGADLRIAKITPELVDFLKHVEIDLTLYMQIEQLKKINPDIKKLIGTFALTT
jgi:hypothetical protein